MIDGAPGKIGPKCERCGAAMVRKRKFCDECKNALQQEKVRREANVRKWHAVVGTERETEIARVWTQQSVVFDSSWHEKLSPTDPSGKLLDLLIGVCFSKSPYLTATDASRHIAFLDHLKEYVFDHEIWGRPTKPARVKEIPIANLSRAIEEWIFSFFEGVQRPLMPSFALDTAMFVQKHVDDFYSRDPEPWAITSVVQSRTERRIINFDDPHFKRRFSESMGTIHAVVQIPSDCKIVSPSGGTVGAPREEFLSSIRRCHLSHGLQDRSNFQCVDTTRPRFDIEFDFEFYSHALWNERGFASPGDALEEVRNAYGFWPTDLEHCGLGSRDRRYAGVAMFVPAHWIKCVVDHGDDSWRSNGNLPSYIEVPHWRAEIEYESNLPRHGL